MSNATATAKEIIEMGKMIAGKKMTVREVAKQTYYAKSTVHSYMIKVLPELNRDLAEEVAKVLAYHKAVRHVRGGEATARSWKARKGVATA